MKENKAGTSVVSRYDYTVNAIGQRTNVAQTGTAFSSVRDIAWGYNAKGEVTKADSTIPGLDRAYAFDMIGNRLKSADSLTLPAANNYTPNALNQYSSITNPQSAILNPLHDADGNMTSGPLPANVNANSTLVWDGENRLIQAQVNGGATVNFTYDAQSRRIAETIGIATKITIYDGWNPIAEYSTTYALTKTYIWGVDLSGSMQGAGGVGGLLAVTDSTGTYFPTFDGNGNVSEYLDSTGAIAAHYEYDPFGKTTVATGPKANDFAHRFSTKPLDAATGLYYYGYRFYDPETGRWPSRDPIGERGGVNLYGFCYNNTGLWFDILGQQPALFFPPGAPGSEYNQNIQDELENPSNPPALPDFFPEDTTVPNQGGYGTVHNNSHTQTICYLKDPVQTRREIFEKLAEFSLFNGNSTNQTAYLDKKSGVVTFSPPAHVQTGMRLLSTYDAITVVKTTNPSAHEVYARTTGSHFLVGRRTWGVSNASGNPAIGTIYTNATEQFASRWFHGMDFMASFANQHFEAQVSVIWKDYLNNVTNEFVSQGKIKVQGNMEIKQW